MAHRQQQEMSARAIEALARAWNRLDFGVVAPYLDEDVVYESPETELQLAGKRQVLGYLERKAALIAAAGEGARVRAELGFLASTTGSLRPCVISTQGDRGLTALFLPTIDGEGLIGRVEVATSDPDPETAVASGVVPD